MKLFVKVLLAAVVLAVALPFVMFGPGGGPLLRLSDLETPQVIVPKLPEVSLPSLGSEQAAPRKVYKWQDAGGQWHMGDEAPDEGINVEVLEVDPNKNVYSAPPSPATDRPANNGDGVAASPLSAYTPEGVKALMDQAHGVEDLMNEHQQKLQGAAGE